MSTGIKGPTRDVFGGGALCHVFAGEEAAAHCNILGELDGGLLHTLAGLCGEGGTLSDG